MGNTKKTENVHRPTTRTSSRITTLKINDAIQKAKSSSSIESPRKKAGASFILKNDMTAAELPTINTKADEDINEVEQETIENASESNCLSTSTVSKTFKLIDLETAVSSPGYCHAAHAIIWADLNDVVVEDFQGRAAVMMQMRFDGRLGFPGGIIDEKLDSYRETFHRIRLIEDGLNRELKEEVNLNPEKILITSEHYLSTHQNAHNNIMLHFYAYKMDYKDFCEMEVQSLKSKDFGHEVLGSCRVPLYTMANGYNGFPAFLDNVFAGNAKEQLLEALTYLKLMSADEIRIAQAASRRILQI